MDKSRRPWRSTPHDDQVETHPVVEPAVEHAQLLGARGLEEAERSVEQQRQRSSGSGGPSTVHRGRHDLSQPSQFERLAKDSEETFAHDDLP